MDVDGARVVGRDFIIIPKVISEPRIGLGDRDQVPCPFGGHTITPEFARQPHLIDARRLIEHGTHFIADAWIVHINMRDLVIGDRKGTRATAVESFAAEFIFEREPTFLPKQTIQVHRSAHRRDAVLGEHDHAHAASLIECDQIARDVVDFFQFSRNLRRMRAELLQRIIQMRQINQAQRWRMFFFDPLRG